MEIPRETIKKIVFDYTVNTQECSLTLWYGFASSVLQDYEPYLMVRTLRDFWMPKLQAVLLDSGQVGGARAYCPHRRQRGTAVAYGGTPTTDEVTQNMPGGISLLFRMFQSDRPSKLQKRVYVPCGVETAVTNGSWVFSPPLSTAVVAFRDALYARIPMPGNSSEQPAIPCIRSTTALGGGSPELPKYYSVEDALLNARPAQRRSRQLSNVFAWTGAAQGAIPEGDPIMWAPTPGFRNPETVPPVVAPPAEV